MLTPHTNHNPTQNKKKQKQPATPTTQTDFIMTQYQEDFINAIITDPGNCPWVHTIWADIPGSCYVKVTADQMRFKIRSTRMFYIYETPQNVRDSILAMHAGEMPDHPIKCILTKDNLISVVEKIPPEKSRPKDKVPSDVVLTKTHKPTTMRTTRRIRGIAMLIENENLTKE